MDDGQEQGNYEERLREVFDSFDTSGVGSLSPEELSELCQSLHLDDATPVLQALLQNQDHLDARVDFEQFKNALILVLSSNIEPQQSEEETLTKPDSPEIQPKFVKGSKRYGRRSTPEFIEPISDLPEVRSCNPEEEEVGEDNYDSAVPRKRERWNSNETSTEEYESEGQMHLWNPDEPSTPRGPSAPSCLEERLREACSELMISWEGCASHAELLVLSKHLGLELNLDLLQSLQSDGIMSVEEFVSRVVNQKEPQTPSASTPYRQLKRHHSTQPFDEGGRRLAPHSALTSTIGMRLFSTLDDGTGFTPVEYILDAWLDEGIENSTEILQALNFDLDGKLSLSDLTTALENELLVTKNGIHQAAVASFKAEIRHLLERVEGEVKEKEKILSDLEKAEKLKNQLATEVDEHHSAIEHKNNLNLRKLEQDHKEKLAAVRSELMKEMDQLKQQAGLQREELEAEVQKIRDDESFLRDHLSISVKENRRLEMELLDSTEKLIDAENQVSKLQTSMENIMKERFGDLDPGSADFFLQEERIKQLRAGYEAQYREMQDRIDELQAELRDYHSLGRVQQPMGQPLSEELESKSPGMESDPGIGSEEVQPFSLSLEAEMMLEQLKDQHLQEMEDLRNQLQSKINDFDMMVEKHKVIQEDQKAALALQHQQELQTLKEEMACTQSQVQNLQSQLEQAELENASLLRTQAEEREALENKREEEVRSLRLQLSKTHTHTTDLEEQLSILNTQLLETDENQVNQMEDLRKWHADEIKKLKQEHVELSEARLEEERAKLQEEKAEMETLLEDLRREREVMQGSHEDDLQARLKEAEERFEHERGEIVQRLTEQWQKERAQLDREHSESLQVLLEEEMLKLVKEHEDKENNLREQWESNVAELQEQQEEAFLQRLLQERLQQQEQFEQREKKLKEQWERERLQLEEDYEGMLQEKLSEEREKSQEASDELEKRQEFLMAQVMTHHQEAIKKLSDKHTEEREALSSTLDKLRDDVAKERRELELSFSQRIREVEHRFSGDQDYVEKRFQAEVMKLEQHYQSELETLSQSHTQQKLLLDTQIQEALQNAEELKKTMEEAMERERMQLNQQWKEDMHLQESQHEKEMEELMKKNQQLQSELDEFRSVAQTTELELSKQLNELHSRLQESLEAREELLAQSERKATEAELLLQQTMEEREELLRNRTVLEAKNAEMLSISEGQVQERIELAGECDDLRMKIEQLEVLLQQAAVDFYLERKELQEQVTILEDRLRNSPENNSTEFPACQSLSSENDLKKESAVGICFEGPENVALADSDSSTPSFSLSLVEQDVEVRVEASCAGEVYDFASNQNENIELGQEKGEVWIYETDMLAESKQEVEGDSVESTSRKGPDLDSSGPNENSLSLDPNTESFLSRLLRAELSALLAPDGSDANKGVKNNGDLESCEEENKPQDVPVWLGVNLSQVEDKDHESVGEPSVLEEADDPDVTSPLDVPTSHIEQELAANLNFEHLTAKINEGGSHGDLETPDEGADCPLLRLQVMCDTATEENILLLEKISLLQQKTEILENLLDHNSERIKTGNQVLEENYSLKVKILLLMEHVKELELKASKASDLQCRYEDCLCENARLKHRNGELAKRVQRLERGVSRWHDFQNHSKGSLLDEIDTLREDNRKFSELLGELERQREVLSAVPAVETLLDLPAEVEGQAANELQDCCTELEKENSGLREAIWALQDESQTLHETTQAQRSEAGRLAEENHLLRQKITALKEEDLKEAHQELIQKLENLNQMKMVAQREAETFSKQVSRLHLQSQQLEDKNRKLSEKDAQNIAEMETLRQQLAELMGDGGKREAAPEADRSELAACVSALETELRKALQDTARMEERNTQLSQQLSVLTEKADKVDAMETQLSRLVAERDGVGAESRGLQNQLDKAEDMVVKIEESLQAVKHQNGCLKSELLDLQHERDLLKHDVTALRKQLQNVGDKNRVLEKALQSSGLLGQSKKRYREEMSRLEEQDQQLLRQENERLQAELRRARDDLLQSREMVRQLDTTVQSLRQQSQPAKARALELENAALKRELAAGGSPGRQRLQQENEALKTQMSQMSAQLIETMQAQLLGLLPPSPHRTPRAQNRGDGDAESSQEERMRRMKSMEERVKEVELSLRNVKLLLREKEAYLKEQLQKNGKADALISDLYVENAQLLKALDFAEQRQKIAEKRNYLLEEKISSLNKIVRDLNPSPVSSLAYQYKCS